jgi:hypothetical protein
MITLKADFNHRDARGRLRLSDLRMHERTPFAQIAERGEHVLFIDGEDVVQGTLVQDVKLGWIGQADWATQEILEAYPAVAAG